ncbi:MAG TPA: hypothetical protein VM734_06370 [Kofleriaceae bacterium]|jgi:hypothetical protein|nr:hypothetical protein [Kofleriaceae bacterium]
MKKTVFALVAATLFSLAQTTTTSAAPPGGGGGGGGDGASCRYCEYHVLGGQFSCAVTSTVGYKNCETWWHMGVHNCKESGGLCGPWYPFPTDVVF